MTLDRISTRLLESEDPSIQWKMRVLFLGEDRDSHRIRGFEEDVRRSRRVRSLVARRRSGGSLERPLHPYAKWQGSHWALAHLADIGYPRGDRALHEMRDRILRLWLGVPYYSEFDAKSASDSYRKYGVARIEGRYRRCASQQGNALYSIEKLGLADKRSDALAERLMHWQWPDGGWNCDRNPTADTSSFFESRHAMLGLALYAQRTGDPAARDAARRAAEVFLSRHLFVRRSNGQVMDKEFVVLHYPLYYYYYDILGGLKAMAEIGLIGDPRCGKALDRLEEKQLAGGGWAAERRFYRVSSTPGTRTVAVDWGGTSTKRMNEWVTADALHVLKAAGRL